MDCTHLKVGDDVRVLNSSYKVAQEGRPGKVSAVRRALFDVEVQAGTEKHPYTVIMTFRRESGYVNREFDYHYVRTAAQLAEEARRAEAVATLKDADLEFRSSWAKGHASTEMLEALAAVVREHTTKEG